MAFLYRRAVFSGEVFFQRDVQLLWLTQVETLVRGVAAGAWPVWNPFLAFGQPLWADANVQIAYPPTWLNFVLRPWHTYTLYVVAHMLLGAAGLYRLGRRWGLSRAAATVAGAVWTVAGPTVSAAPMWNQLAGAAWLPWAVDAAEGALEGARIRRAWWWGICLAAPVLAGSPEAALMGAVLGAVLAGRRAFDLGARTALRGALVPLGVAGAFALALSAAQWLPSLEAARHSARASLTPEARAYWSVHPLALAQLAFPVLVDAAGLRPDVAAALSESREPFFVSLYLGLAATGLVLAAWAGPSRRGRAFASGVMLAGALVALGRHLPIYAAMEVLLPPLKALRYPAKAMVLVAFGWALLAGMGFEAWRDRGARPRRFGLGVMAPLGALTLVTALVLALVARDPARWGAMAFAPPAPGLTFADLLAPTRQRLLAAALAAAAVCTVAALGRRLAAPAGAAIVALCAVAELLVAHHALNPTAPAALYLHRPELLDTAAPAGGARLYAYDYFFSGRSMRYLGRPVPYPVARAPEGWPIRAAQALGLRLYLFPPAGGPWGVQGSYDLDVPGLGSPHVAALTELLRAVEGTPAHGRLLRLGAVGRVVALHEKGLEDLRPVAQVESLFPEPIRVFGVDDALPRTYAVGDASVADGPGALRALLDPSFDAAREVLLADGPAARAGASFSGTSRIVSMALDRVVVEAELGAPGYVVLVDAWDPAWRAWVDGGPAEVRRANVAFRAVGVPAGRHVIEMRYRPATLTLGIGATLLAAAASIALAARRPTS